MPKLTKEEFIKRYQAESNLSATELETFFEDYIVLPCNCDIINCKGWVVVSNDKLSIKTHNEIYNHQ